MRKRELVRKNSRPYEILKCLALGSGAVLLAVLAPNAGAEIIRAGVRIQRYIRKKRFERARFLQDLKRLQVRRLIRIIPLNDGRTRLILTKRGRKTALAYKLDEIKLRKPKPWDGEWRLVMFDIPHYYKETRDVLREKLRSLEFYPLQKSVFLTPYPCEDEIDFIASYYNVRRFILILYVSHFEDEEKFKYYFGLTS